MPIRPARVSDADLVAVLAAQLGYPTTAAEVARRLSRLEEDLENHQVLVATDAGDRVVGWAHVLVHHGVATDSRAEVAALVVDEGSRGQGHGRALMERAEGWAAERGFGLMRLSSQTRRVEAHRFYERLGYEIQKTSHVLVKQLPSASTGA